MYQEFVERASSELCETIMDHEPDLADRARFVDRDVLEILREVGLVTMEKIFSMLSSKLEEEGKAEGLAVQTRPVITFHAIFGPVEIASPYL